MKTILGILCLVATVASAQESARVAVPPPPPQISLADQDDPGQSLYKKGYAAILDKKWDQARAAFAELAKKYPKSKYVDAAKYWTAYAAAQTDRKEAEKLYQQFLEQYQESKYFDDAVADFERLTLDRERLAVIAPVPPPPPKPTVEVAPVVPDLVEAERFMELPYPDGSRSHREADPALQLKMDAIRALGENVDDKQAFETVKAIAVDLKQPVKLREVALQTLGRFKGEDPVAVYLQVASSGDEDLRQMAITGIGHVADKGDERALQALRTYATDRAEPRKVREAALVGLVRLEEPGMLGVLTTIAQADPDRDLRTQAVFMMARAGKGDEARALTSLKSIASDESQHRQVREAALQALSMLNSDESLAYVKSMATGSKDKSLRLGALYALGRYRNDPSSGVSEIFRTIAQNPQEDRELRLVALYSLRQSAGEGSRKLLTSLALKDDDEEIRQGALHMLIEASDDKAAILSTLIDVFEKSGEQDRKMRETALYGIANVGNDQAVAYLATVAKTNADYDIRRRAIYYLGSVGGEKAKAALLEILKEP